MVTAVRVRPNSGETVTATPTTVITDGSIWAASMSFANRALRSAMSCVVVAEAEGSANVCSFPAPEFHTARQLCWSSTLGTSVGMPSLSTRTAKFGFDGALVLRTETFGDHGHASRPAETIYPAGSVILTDRTVRPFALLPNPWGRRLSARRAAPASVLCDNIQRRARQR